MTSPPPCGTACRATHTYSLLRFTTEFAIFEPTTYYICGQTYRHMGSTWLRSLRGRARQEPAKHARRAHRPWRPGPRPRPIDRRRLNPSQVVGVRASVQPALRGSRMTNRERTVDAPGLAGTSRFCGVAVSQCQHRLPSGLGTWFTSRTSARRRCIWLPSRPTSRFSRRTLHCCDVAYHLLRRPWDRWDRARVGGQCYGESPPMHRGPVPRGTRKRREDVPDGGR